MKYKELNIGDWFAYKNKVFVKTYCPDFGVNYDFCLSPSSVSFGGCFQSLPDEAEIKFLSQLNVYNPYPQKGINTLAKAPLHQFLALEYRGEKIIFIKINIRSQEYTLALNGKYGVGMWEKSTSVSPVEVIPRIDLKYEEKLLTKRLKRDIL